jgi:hypothetical protein
MFFFLFYPGKGRRPRFDIYNISLVGLLHIKSTSIIDNKNLIKWLLFTRTYRNIEYNGCFSKCIVKHPSSQHAIIMLYCFVTLAINFGVNACVASLK